MAYGVICRGGVGADKNPQHKSAEKATNRVTVLQSIENIEGVTSLISEAHNAIYQFGQKNDPL